MAVVLVGLKFNLDFHGDKFQVFYAFRDAGDFFIIERLMKLTLMRIKFDFT